MRSWVVSLVQSVKTLFLISCWVIVLAPSEKSKPWVMPTKAARKMPEKYQNLKVRVSGYSASYVYLPKEHQEEILNRTVQQ